jgi:site-specific DNA recombinase
MMGRMMGRAVIYARVSSREQRERNTIESQLHELPLLAERLGLGVDATYIDNGISGAALLERRQGLLGMLERIKGGDISHVLVFDLDRFTRDVSMAVRGRIFGAIQNSGAVIAEYTSGAKYDLGTFEGRLTVQIRAELSADWLEKHKQRIVLGKERAIRENRKPAGPTPYGYDYDRASGTFSIHEAEAAVLREIYASIAAGVSCAAIAESLNLDATPGARAQRRRKASHWTSDRVWRLATSRTYRGEWTVNKAHGAVITVPTIIDPGDWDATQRAMTSPLRGTPRGKSPIICLASRLARCALCGSVVQVHMRSGGAAGRRYQYYVCRAVSHPRTKAEKCPLKARRIEEVDARLWAAVERFLVEGWPEIEARMLTAIQARQGHGDEARDELEQAERELRRLASAEDALLVRFRRGAVSEAALDVALAALAEDRRAAEVERDRGRAELGREAAGVESLGRAIAAARALLPDAPPEIRQQLVRALIEPGALRLGQWSIEATVSLSWDALSAGAALQDGSSPRRAHQPRDLAYRMAVELVA